MALPLPFQITDPPEADAIQGNFDAIKKEFPLSRKNMQVEGVHKVGDADEPAFQNSWVNYDTATFREARFWKDPMGIVHVEGLVKNGSAAPSTVFTLPAGYRPGNGLIFAVIANNVAARVDVAPTGNIVWQTGGSNAFLSLAGITFKQEQ